MFASQLFSSKAEADDFCGRLEHLLRQGHPDQALAELEAQMERLGESEHPIAGLIADAAQRQVDVAGWSELGGRIAALDVAGAPITALGIDMSWPGHVGLEPDEEGRLDPHIETSFYKDDAFPFSTADRTALLAGYAGGGSEWQGCFSEIDSTIEIHGLEALYGAVHRIEQDRGGEHPAQAQDLALIGGLYVAVRIHLAVVEAVLHGGLPRPLSVLVGSNEAFPFFDAPVVTADEYRQFAPLQADQDGSEIEGIEDYEPEPEPEFTTETVEEVVEEAINPEPEIDSPLPDAPAAETDQDALHLPDPAHHVSGRALRRRAQQSEAEEAALAAQQGPAKADGLLARLFRRK